MTGTLGTALAQLHHKRSDQVFGCARNEARCVEWINKYPQVGTLYVADARNLAESTDIGRLLPSMDVVYHCAAMKHVDLCEQDPSHAVYHNVNLTEKIASICQFYKIRFVFASSDKACLPQGVYGATKLIAEAITLKFGGAVCRFGNLIGSSGSVFRVWKQQADEGQPIRITDPSMTRYFIPTGEAARFMMDQHQAGFITIPHPLKAIALGAIVRALAAPKYTIIGRRPGETQHQWLVAPGDRILLESGRLRICPEGSPCNQGMHSAASPADCWDPQELLAYANV